MKINTAVKSALTKFNAVALMDERGHITYVNDQLCQLTYHRKEELVGQPVGILNDNLIANEFWNQICDQTSEGKFWVTQLQSKRKDGRTLWFEATIIPIKKRFSRTTSCLALFHCISASKFQERLLETATKESFNYKYALDQTSIVTISDVKGNITYANSLFCAISKYSKDELIGSNQNLLNSDYHDAEFWNSMWLKIGRGEVWKNEVRNRCKDGSYFWLEMTVIPFLNGINKPYQYLSISKDITDKKENFLDKMNILIHHEEQQKEFLAEDLHEGVVQSLAALKFQIENLENKMEEIHCSEIASSIEQIKSFVNENIHSTRNLAKTIMPRSMMQHGLIASLQNNIDKINNDRKNFISLSEEIKNTEFNKNIEISIYRLLVTIIDQAHLNEHISNIHIFLSQKDELLMKLEMLGDQHFKLFDNTILCNRDVIAHFNKLEFLGGKIEINNNPIIKKLELKIEFN